MNKIFTLKLCKYASYHRRHEHGCPGAKAPIGIIMGGLASIRILDIYNIYKHLSFNNFSKRLLQSNSCCDQNLIN